MFDSVFDADVLIVYFAMNSDIILSFSNAKFDDQYFFLYYSVSKEVMFMKVMVLYR